MADKLVNNLSSEQRVSLQEKVNKQCRRRGMEPIDITNMDAALWKELVFRICGLPKQKKGSPARSLEEIMEILDHVQIIPELATEEELAMKFSTKDKIYAFVERTLKVKRMKHKTQGGEKPGQIVKGIVSKRTNQEAHRQREEENRKEMESWPPECWD
ncbi:MAG: hypothetical protein DI628_05295 [Blastochloris viridis]|uniref:Uncharacterized protein n=1 Tax=Blastochloris viridis TaxID=1079 RepID=A0A6N4R680_BLAVI|nr:MAG: hypothetical protein DI628_05295 [Blastochloris viridis]